MVVRGVVVKERRRGNVLAQWEEDGMLRRGWLREREPGWTPTEADVELAAPYGDPFEDVLPTVSISPEVLADTLRRVGIWTVQDAMRNPTTVAQAIASAAKLDVASVQASLRALL
ncbi:MAG: hypothetical protein PHF64_10835 [Methanoregula sp.]|nr:hypothetical protein [Methanoregula sp.]